MKDKLIRWLTPFHIFALFVLLGFAGYLFYAYRYGSGTTDFFMMENNDLMFCDLKMHVGFVADPKNIYFRAGPGTGCFPPLSYLLYYFIVRILVRGSAVPGVDFPYEEAPYINLVIVYYSIAVALLLLWAILMWRENRQENRGLKRGTVLFICLMLSVPFFAGGVSVANSTLIVMALLLIALNLREQDSPVLNEIAIIIIAVCAGFKIYPAVFGLLYLLEKRFKEAVRLTIYGIVLFFAPFALFGGVQGFSLWLGNVKSTMGFEDYGRIQCIKGLLVTVAEYLHIRGIPGAVYSVIPFLFVILMIVLASITKNRYRRIFYLCAIMSFFPTNAYRYTLCYLSVPFVMMFMEEPGDEDATAGSVSGVARLDTVFIYIATVLFSLVYAMPVLLGKILQFRSIYDVYTLTYVEIWTYTFAYLLLITVIIHEISCSYRMRRRE